MCSWNEVKKHDKVMDYKKKSKFWVFSAMNLPVGM